jgi:hypothetical protein
MKAHDQETAFLAACLDGSPERLVRFPLESGELWEGLVRVASREFLLPALHQRLSENGIKAPAEVADFLALVEDLNAERNARILDEMWGIARLLNAVGIEPLALKGAAILLGGMYPRPGCRYLCDLDILVPRSQVALAAETLERDGYRQDDRDALARFRHHHPPLQKPRANEDHPEDGSGSAPLELHHSLGHGLSRRLLSGEEMLNSSSVLERNGARIRIPSPEHLVTHLILHSQLHHSYSERIWAPPRAMYDLATLNRHFGSALNWELVRERFRANGQELTLALHLLQTERTLGMPLPLAFDLGWAGRLRWARRKALNKWPGMRLIDPVYLTSSTLSRRMQFLRSITEAPGGWKYATRVLFRPGFYRRIFAEIALK